MTQEQEAKLHRRISAVFYSLLIAMTAFTIIIVLACYNAHATETHRLGLWINGECCTDCWDQATESTEVCVALGEPEYLYPDLDYQVGDHMGSDYNVPQSPVPEPMTALLLATGIVGLVVGRRRKHGPR